MCIHFPTFFGVLFSTTITYLILNSAFKIIQTQLNITPLLRRGLAQARPNDALHLPSEPCSGTKFFMTETYVPRTDAVGGKKGAGLACY